MKLSYSSSTAKYLPCIKRKFTVASLLEQNDEAEQFDGIL